MSSWRSLIRYFWPRERTLKRRNSGHREELNEAVLSLHCVGEKAERLLSASYAAGEGGARRRCSGGHGDPAPSSTEKSQINLREKIEKLAELRNTSIHEVPGNAKEGADDGHSGDYMLLVPTVQEYSSVELLRRLVDGGALPRVLGLLAAELVNFLKPTRLFLGLNP
nr:hypothetical protein Iba_chr09aCG8540 [Ipomoea batatas]